VSIPNIPEKELLGRCLRGDKQAWDLFVLRYSRLIRHSLYHTLKHKNLPLRTHDLDDLHHGVFLSLIADDYRKLRQFRGKNGCSLGNWVRIIAVRKAIDYLRSDRPTKSIEGELNTDEHSYEYPDRRPNAEENLIKSEEIRIIAQVIKRLPPRYQFFVELYYRRELPIEEISQIMSLGPNGVYQLHHRIKERLRKILTDDYPEMVATA